jgi:mannose-1-phosphate guanylyltransferase
MFMWRTGTVLEGLARHVPELHEVLSSIDSALGTRPLSEVLNEQYRRAPAISIDFSLMEKADNVAVMRADFAWSDVGSWEFVRDIHPCDAQGNVTLGEHVVVDGANNTIVSRRRLVGMIGVDDVVVVDSDDAILVCRRDRVQEVKNIVAELRRRGRTDVI